MLHLNFHLQPTTCPGCTGESTRRKTQPKQERGAWRGDKKKVKCILQVRFYHQIHIWISTETWYIIISIYACLWRLENRRYTEGTRQRPRLSSRVIQVQDLASKKTQRGPIWKWIFSTNYHLITQILPLMTQFPDNFLIDPPNWAHLFALSSSSEMGLLLLEAERGLMWEPGDLFCWRRGTPRAAEDPLQHTLRL